MTSFVTRIFQEKIDININQPWWQKYSDSDVGRGNKRSIIPKTDFDLTEQQHGVCFSTSVTRTTESHQQWSDMYNIRLRL